MALQSHCLNRTTSRHTNRDYLSIGTAFKVGAYYNGIEWKMTSKKPGRNG